jgi:hypothetical protein
LGSADDNPIPYEIGQVTTGGTLVASTSGTEKKEISLKKGFYRIELAGSRGGDGGTGENQRGIGARGGYINTVIYIPYTITATIFSAKRGDKGEDGGYTDDSDDPDGRTAGGGGGGGGGGTAGFIIILLFMFFCAYGGGGGGGAIGGKTGTASIQT